MRSKKDQIFQCHGHETQAKYIATITKDHSTSMHPEYQRQILSVWFLGTMKEYMEGFTITLQTVKGFIFTYPYFLHHLLIAIVGLFSSLSTFLQGLHVIWSKLVQLKRWGQWLHSPACQRYEALHACDSSSACTHFPWQQKPTPRGATKMSRGDQIMHRQKTLPGHTPTEKVHIFMIYKVIVYLHGDI